MALRWKHLSIKKFGWKRVAKNVQKFGWELTDATEFTTTTTTHEYTGETSGNEIRFKKTGESSSSKVRMELDFCRDSADFENLLAISPLEILYNLVFLVRRILGFFLPISLIPIAIIGFMGQGNEQLMSDVGIWFSIALFVWLGLIIAEGVISSIAKKILKPRI